MAATVKFDEDLSAELTPAGWQCPDETLCQLLELRQKQLGWYSHRPDFEKLVAEDAALMYGGEVTHVDDPLKGERGKIY